jgi:hypothetical protein
MSADGILAEDVASVTADKRAIGLNCADSPTNTTSSPRRRGGTVSDVDANAMGLTASAARLGSLDAS